MYGRAAYPSRSWSVREHVVSSNSRHFLHRLVYFGRMASAAIVISREWHERGTLIMLVISKSNNGMCDINLSRCKRVKAPAGTAVQKISEDPNPLKLCRPRKRPSNGGVESGFLYL